MLSLIYVSSAVHPFSTADLSRLLEISRSNNARRRVTGMLLYKDGNFMQAIEGEQSDVCALFAKLKLDPRHGGFLTLLEEEIPERQFQDWSMGFTNLDDPAVNLLDGYREYRNVSFVDKSLTSEPSRAKKLLEVFRQKM
jgi:hypothetical protein